MNYYDALELIRGPQSQGQYTPGGTNGGWLPDPRPIDTPNDAECLRAHYIAGDIPSIGFNKDLNKTYYADFTRPIGGKPTPYMLNETADLAHRDMTPITGNPFLQHWEPVDPKQDRDYRFYEYGYKGIYPDNVYKLHRRAIPQDRTPKPISDMPIQPGKMPHSNLG